MQLIARVWPEDGEFVAECVELRVVSQGDTEDAAVANLREAVEAFLECADRDEVRERLHAGTSVRTCDVPVAFQRWASCGGCRAERSGASWSVMASPAYGRKAATW